MTTRTEHSHIFETGDAIGLELLDRHFMVRFHAALSGGAINFHGHTSARMAHEPTSALRLVISAHLQNKGAVPFAISVQSGEKSTFFTENLFRLDIRLIRDINERSCRTGISLAEQL